MHFRFMDTTTHNKTDRQYFLNILLVNCGVTHICYCCSLLTGISAYNIGITANSKSLQSVVLSFKVLLMLNGEIIVSISGKCGRFDSTQIETVDSFWCTNDKRIESANAMHCDKQKPVLYRSDLAETIR